MQVKNNLTQTGLYLIQNLIKHIEFGLGHVCGLCLILPGVVVTTDVVIIMDIQQDLFMKSMLDSVFKVVLGVELDTICGSNKEGTQFSDSFVEASELTFYRYVDPFWKAKRFLNVGSEAKLRNSLKVVDQYVKKVIQSKIEEIHKLQESSVLPVSNHMLDPPTPS